MSDSELLNSRIFLTFFWAFALICLSPLKSSIVTLLDGESDVEDSDEELKDMKIELEKLL
jgi:hypothetical protein